ncbi:hypothetical protein QFC19_006826 [Naganishia cerealis]|uniref:Uncharacterized protein n=1 Tax=Naganishia cerealis TaxID=610337 RepID=A0ACC2VDA8_9TREE|nr:hypothetical protein QFC19_006826 [Naganishia cerealis]
MARDPPHIHPEHQVVQIQAVLAHDTSSPLPISAEQLRGAATYLKHLAMQSSAPMTLDDGDAPHEQYPFPINTAPAVPQPSPIPGSGQGNHGAKTVYILLPVFVILSTLLVLLIAFLIGILYSKRRKGIRLVEDGGPLDLSRNDGVIGEGGVEGVESRWLEQVSEDVRQGYKRGKDYQQQYPPSSIATDITLSQFLSIQEKGVSAWCFEPDYESNPSMYVESRTEITFLADGPGMAMREGGANTVLANLPIPKINEVYYFEAKMYEKPPATEVVVGLATKPYPSFRMPGWNKISVGYFSSDGFKCHNYPFTAASHGPSLNEGDVLGVGYRPRTGTVFFTKNGRKLDDCYTGLSSYNLFPAIGSNGAASVHINLGQAGFVFIEANVKKWGLAPMVGTLAPPPAYGSERGSILLDAGYGVPGASNVDTLGTMARRLIASGGGGGGHSSTSEGHASQPIPASSSVGRSPGSRRTTSQRERRLGTSHGAGNNSSAHSHPSPLHEADEHASDDPAVRSGSGSDARDNLGGTVAQPRYHSPTDRPELTRSFPSVVGEEEETASIDDYHSTRSRPVSSRDSASELDDDDGSPRDDGRDRYNTPYRDEDDAHDGTQEGEMYDGWRHSPDDSPLPHNPPTPNVLDISLRSIRQHQESSSYFGGRADRDQSVGAAPDAVRRRERRRRRRAEAQEGAGGGSTNRQQQRGLEARLHALVSGAIGQQNDQPPPGYSPLDPNVYSRALVVLSYLFVITFD